MPIATDQKSLKKVKNFQLITTLHQPTTTEKAVTPCPPTAAKAALERLDFYPCQTIRKQMAWFHRMTYRLLRGALPSQAQWRPHGKRGHPPTPHLRSCCSPSLLGVVSEKAQWGVRSDNDTTVLSTTTSILASVEAMWGRVTAYFLRRSNINGSILGSLNFYPPLNNNEEHHPCISGLNKSDV